MGIVRGSSGAGLADQEAGACPIRPVVARSHAAGRSFAGHGSALTAGELIRYGRCVNYLRDFRKQMTRAADAAAVTDFNEQARGSRLWQIASRPDKAAA